MVSVKQLEGDYPFVKSNVSSEQSKCNRVPVRGIKTQVFRFGSTAKGYSATAEEGQGQSLLDTLLLSRWEECSWKGQLTYDVTMCETKIICGGKKLIAQLNEKWNANFLAELENTLQPLEPSKQSHMKILCENLLFCVANGEKENSEFVASAVLPKDGTLIIVNVNPVEYGHIFLVPYDISQKPKFLDKKMLCLISQFAKEIDSVSFRVFYDHSASAYLDHVHFQAGYCATPLPVEHLPVVPVYSCADHEGVNIYEFADFPLKALLFTSQNLELLVGLVAEICSILQHDKNVVFNLLVSDCAKKVFLFPQVNLLATGTPLSTWECGGYFVYNTRSEFDSASEAELSKRLAAASLDDKGFQGLKQLCVSTAVKIAQ